jgi:hypothetical protein
MQVGFWSQRFEASMYHLNLDTHLFIFIFEVNLEHIGPLSTYDHVRPTSLLVSLVFEATDPLVSREEVTFPHIVLGEYFNTVYGIST